MRGGNVIKVVFKNLKKSDLIRQIATDRIEKTIKKFPEFDKLSSSVIVSREHSQEHPGISEFAVKLLMKRKGLKPIVLEKRAETLYQAIALVTDRALEILHRANEKIRLENRHIKRSWKSSHKWSLDMNSWYKKGA